MITIPFNIELAKKIQAEKHPGKITTRDGKDVRVLCFDAKRCLPIVSLVKENEKQESLQSYTRDRGYYGDGDISDYDLVLQVPEWTQYKEGDVLKTCGNAIIVFDRFDDNEQVKFHAALDKGFKILMYPLSQNAVWSYKSGIERYASEDEKQMFVDKLKKENSPEAKDILKRFFHIEETEEKPECEFKFLQPVLVRGINCNKWLYAEFTHKDGELFFVNGGNGFSKCIPYNDETKHLIGTTDSYNNNN